MYIILAMFSSLKPVRRKLVVGFKAASESVLNTSLEYPSYRRGKCNIVVCCTEIKVTMAEK